MLARDRLTLNEVSWLLIKVFFVSDPFTSTYREHENWLVQFSLTRLLTQGSSYLGFVSVNAVCS